MKTKLTIAINPELVARCKEAAGLVPLSRWIEHMLKEKLRLVEGANPPCRNT